MSSMSCLDEELQSLQALCSDGSSFIHQNQAKSCDDNDTPPPKKAQKAMSKHVAQAERKTAAPVLVNTRHGEGHSINKDDKSNNARAQLLHGGLLATHRKGSSKHNLLETKPRSSSWSGPSCTTVFNDFNISGRARLGSVVSHTCELLLYMYCHADNLCSGAP